MTYNEFLDKVIDEGIAAAKVDYENEKYKNKLDGSIAGFEACRNKHPEELIDVFKEASPYMGDPETHWYFRCYQMEVEWVMNVVSAMLHNQGQPPLLSWLPTCNGMRKAASILGIGLE